MLLKLARSIAFRCRESCHCSYPSGLSIDQALFHLALLCCVHPPFRMCPRVAILQADLESLLESPSGNPLNFNKAAALHAFGLYCRLSVHLQYTVGCHSSSSSSIVSIVRQSCFCSFASVLCRTVLPRREDSSVHLERNRVLVGKQSFTSSSRPRRGVPEASEGRLSAGHPGQQPGHGARAV